MEFLNRKLKVIFCLLFAIFCLSYYHKTGRVLHPKCHCKLPMRETKLNIPKKNLTCSEFAGLRGFNQKVISYTYYELNSHQKKSLDRYNRDYFAGIERNLKSMTSLYGSKWVMRLYYQIPETSPNWSRLCDLVCTNHQIDICDIEENPRYGNLTKVHPPIWRFLAPLDLTVDTVLVRDLDSNISPREVAAVQEFLQSPKEFHIMRDHPHHGTPILAGMWGIKLENPEVRKKFSQSIVKITKDPGTYEPGTKAGPDQYLLERYIWPWARAIAMSHDAYSCKEFSHTSPFPTQRTEGLGNFVGSVVDTNSSLPFQAEFVCPKKCRPKNHQDWIYC